MGKALIIVESPAKIKTLQKFLGKDFLFASSLGHIRDLPQKGFGIDVENNFEPQYATLPEKEDVIANLQKLASKCDIVYLSPDPDREGEAIAWHIASILPEGKIIKRAAFNAITKEAVTYALENPQELNIALVNAQQARRLLDRIVGYKISPILARKIRQRKGISAGRVQSVALKMVVDREKEIEKFIPVEYWNISTLLLPEKQEKSFLAHLYSIDGKKWEKEAQEGKDLALISSKEQADAIVKRLEKAHYQVAKIERKEKRRNPEPPFITSTLQQEASRHYRFSASKTMNIAQTLYEGVDMGNEGTEGLITYMRTDSVRTAPEGLNEVRKYILSKFGESYLPASPRNFSSKKSAQDAHEAIRPTNLNHPPDVVKPFLNREQHLLYELIWKRFIASQMNPAIYDTVSADITTDQAINLRATGSIIKFSGFLAIYEEKEDDEEKQKENEDRLLPHLEEGQPLNLVKINSEQAFTKAPPRFSEASLVKELEKSGIGRPSTYATIMNKIQSREYTVKENQRLKPTELGKVIAQFLEDNFQQIMNVGFTASMEDTLELIAENQKAWKDVISEFWTQFIPTVEIAEKEAFVPKLMTDLICPKCGSHLQKIWAKSRYFYGCSSYPECDYTTTTEEMSFNKEDYAENFDWDQPCPTCSKPMKLRHGRFGPFLGCSNYPECKGIVNIPKKGEQVPSLSNMPSCPAIGCDGKMVARKSRFGKTFFSCSNFPDCDVIINDVDKLSEKYPNHPKTAYIKKTNGKKRGKGKEPAAKATATKSSKKTDAAKSPTKRKSPTFKLSEELAAVVGAPEMARGEVLKKIWDYIREHNCQDPNDKRKIIPDAKLQKVFKTSEAVDMFKLSGIIGQHLQK